MYSNREEDSVLNDVISPLQAMMMPHHHDHDEHDFHLHQHQENSGLLSHTDQHSMNMWKGLVAMISLVSFFFTEKTLNMLAEWHKHRQRRNKVNKKLKLKLK